MCFSGGGSVPIATPSPVPPVDTSAKATDILLMGSKKRQQDLMLTGRALYGRDSLRTSLGGVSTQPNPLQLGGVPN